MSARLLPLLTCVQNGQKKRGPAYCEIPRSDVVPETGLEPVRMFSPTVFKTVASAISPLRRALIIARPPGRGNLHKRHKREQNHRDRQPGHATQAGQRQQRQQDGADRQHLVVAEPSAFTSRHGRSFIIATRGWRSRRSTRPHRPVAHRPSPRLCLCQCPCGSSRTGLQVAVCRLGAPGA